MSPLQLMENMFSPPTTSNGSSFAPTVTTPSQQVAPMVFTSDQLTFMMKFFNEMILIRDKHSSQTNVKDDESNKDTSNSTAEVVTPVIEGNVLFLNSSEFTYSANFL